jgi:2',3'-cyclic-nucleotide 2'-phosphodiesterase (5'-nucleotidase family)
LYRDVSPLISRITFDTGDMFTGMLSNLTRGESLMEMMAGMKYDAMAIGNHEFDYGSDNFEKQSTEFSSRSAHDPASSLWSVSLWSVSRVRTLTSHDRTSCPGAP